MRGATPKGAGRATVGKVVLVIIALCVTASGLTWAALGRIEARYAAAPFGAGSPAQTLPSPTVPDSLSPTSPSKEFIYAGGRLVATEEPTLFPAPTNLKFIRTLRGPSRTEGYLTWLDNSANETGFTIEINSGATWRVDAQVGANVNAYNVVVKSPPLADASVVTYRVKAVGPSATSPYSNSVTVAAHRLIPSDGCTPQGGLIVSEFRLRGAAGARDEFIELYNNSDSVITVCTADTSGGWTLAARSASGASAAPVFTVPNGTAIPPRAHYLAVNAGPSGGYSLSGYAAGNGTTATGDITYTGDIEDDSGLALFTTANSSNFTAANRLDAAGFAGAAGVIPDLYREGGGLVPVGSQNGEYSFYRTLTSGSGYAPKDTGDNGADFMLVSTEGAVFGGSQSRLGAPGPENLSSPVRRDAVLPAALLDPAAGSSTAPNRIRTFAMEDANTTTFGTLSMRRKVTNTSGAPVTRIRFRVVDITTYPAGGYADLRPISSGPVQVTLTSGQVVTVLGTTVEQPPSQPYGGGWNSTMTLTLPQPLAPGESANFQLVVGLQQLGTYRFIVSAEALP